MLLMTSHSCTSESFWPILGHRSKIGVLFFLENLVRATTLSLEDSRGITSLLIVFMSISLLGLLAKWFSFV